MIRYIRTRRAAARAKAAYDLAVLEGLMAENRRRLDELREPKECPWCKAAEVTAAQPR